MLVVVILLLSATEAVAGSTPQCSVVDRPVVKKVKDLPPGVAQALPQRIADPGEPFHITDAIAAGQEDLPFMRLICGYDNPQGYVIEREQGGRGYNIGKIVFRKTPAGFVRVEPSSGRRHSASPSGREHP